MRLDVYLKLSRLIPKRNLAKEFIGEGLVTVNGNITKAAYAVKLDDVITIKRRNSRTSARVLKIPEKKQVSKKDASSLFELLAHEILDPLND